MATTVDTLITEYKMNSSDYAAGADRVVKATNHMASAVGAGTRVISMAATAVSVVAGALIALTVASSKKAAEFEAMVKALEAVVGSAKDAQKALSELREMAAKPGLGLDEALIGYTKLRQSGMSDSMAMRTINAAGNANALASGGRAEFASILRAMAQMAVKPELSGQELQQLNDANVPGSKIIQDRFGTSDGGELKKLGIDSKQALQALVEGLEKMPKAGNSAKNIIENIMMAIEAGMVGIGTGFNRDFMPFLTDIGDATSEAVDSGVLESFGASLSNLIKSILPDGIETVDGFAAATKNAIGNTTTVAAALRNLTLNLQDMAKFLGADPIRNQILEWLGQGSWNPAQEGMAAERQVELDQKVTAARKRQQKRGTGRYAPETGGMWESVADAKKEIGELSDRSHDYMKEQIDLLRSIDNSLNVITKVTIGGSAYGDGALSPVNLSGAPASIRANQTQSLLAGLTLKVVGRAQGRR